MTTQRPYNIINNDALVWNWRRHSDCWILYNNTVHHNGEKRESSNLTSTHSERVRLLVTWSQERESVDKGIVWTGLPT